jgi:hypothetical protein
LKKRRYLMADPVVGGTATQDAINSYIEKSAASMLGQVMMDIVSDITKEMDPET